MATADLRERRRESYETPRPDVIAHVPPGARRILDLGCASGALGAALKARQGAEVVGIELHPDYAADAERVLDRVLCGDVDVGLADADLGLFDCVIAADVLEHLVDPWDTMQRVVARLEPGGVAVVSLPNVRNVITLVALVWRGRWPRADSGLFDATHLRWFTDRDARDLLENAGLEVIVMEPRYWFSGWALRIVRALGLTPLRPFLAGQFVLVGRRRA